MGNLTGKVALVTGSSRGIGRGIAGIAERLGRDGANVVITYAGNRDKAEEVVAAIESMGSKATAIQVDMRKLEGVRSLFERAIAQFGKVDILVNNAVALLVSDDAHWITGQSIRANGGIV